MLTSKIEAWSNSPSSLLNALARALKLLGAARRFILNPRIRSEQITRAFHRNSHYQAATYSEPNRYPELFEACKRHHQHLAAPTILSFGCATGEEAFTLAEYLPNATIIGVDINRWCLRQCAKKNPNPRIRFLHSSAPDFAALSSFDAIFCMAVFQRTENRTHPTNVAHGTFTFDKFEQEIRVLESKLKIGGLFFIDHADFRFEDTAIAAHYTPLEFEGNQIPQDRPIFGRDSALITTKHPLHRAFLKQSASPH
jgi:SAM-dependent methyltransferase